MPLSFVALADSRSITAAFQRFSFQGFSFSKACVRFKSLEDLALDVRFAGREPYGSVAGVGNFTAGRDVLGREAGHRIWIFGRPRAVMPVRLAPSWSREGGDTVLVKTVGRTVARVPVEEHMANYRAARAKLGKGKSGAKKSTN